MSVSKATVKDIAHLARIRVEEKRLEPLAEELSMILKWVEQLQEVKTDEVEPLASVTGHALPMRDDKITDGDIAEKVLENAPEEASGFFVVPKVVE